MPLLRQNHLSNPLIILCCPLAALVSGVEYASRFDQQELYLALCIWLVLNALWNDEHLSGVHGAVAQINSQGALEDDERLVGVLVIMPNEIALQPDDLELVVVHFRHDLRCPLLAKETELLLKTDWRAWHLLSSRYSKCLSAWRSSKGSLRASRIV